MHIIFLRVMDDTAASVPTRPGIIIEAGTATLSCHGDVIVTSDRTELTTSHTVANQTIVSAVCLVLLLINQGIESGHSKATHALQ